jgi:hypothetical protein
MIISDIQAELVLSGKGHALAILPEPDTVYVCSHPLFMQAILHKPGS